MAAHSGDAIVHIIRTLTDADPDQCVTKTDGVGAYDHIFRDSMLRKLQTLPGASAILPFVLQFYGSPSAYVWRDEAGRPHIIEQGEGGEQGDPLMPALFCLGMHDALHAAAARLQPGERLLANLDDTYTLSSKARARDASDMVNAEVKVHAGIASRLSGMAICLRHSAASWC